MSPVTPTGAPIPVPVGLRGFVWHRLSVTSI